MSAEQVKGNAEGFNFGGVAKPWKEAYLRGLEVFLRSQEENERLAKNVVKQAVTVPKQWVTLYKNWVEQSWDQIQGQTGAGPNPFLTFSRQIVETMQATTEPIVRTTAEAYELTFTFYETALAGPSRKYGLELNKKVLDTIIPV